MEHARAQLRTAKAPAPAMSIPPSDRSTGSGSTEYDSGAAGASFDRLLAMYQDVAALQAAMGDELAKLSATLGRGARPVGVAGGQRPPSTRLPLNRGVAKAPRSAPGVMKAISEESEEPWMQSARKFLPPWAQPGSPDVMSA